jgi:hypothetical protein
VEAAKATNADDSRISANNNNNSVEALAKQPQACATDIPQRIAAVLDSALASGELAAAVANLVKEQANPDVTAKPEKTTEVVDGDSKHEAADPHDNKAVDAALVASEPLVPEASTQLPATSPENIAAPKAEPSDGQKTEEAANLAGYAADQSIPVADTELAEAAPETSPAEVHQEEEAIAVNEAGEDGC